MSTPKSHEREPADERGPVAQLARLFLTQLLAVVAVAAVIATVFALTGRGTGPEVSATAGSSSSVTSSATPTSPGPTSTTKKHSATKAPGTPSTSASSSTPPSSTSPGGNELAKVDVLNQSAPGGSAQTVAHQLDEAGWTIGRVADFHGNVSTTTVYYPVGEAKAAHELANELPGTPRVLPRFSTIADKRLTVIVTR
jgi:hypothetical protein